MGSVEVKKMNVIKEMIIVSCWIVVGAATLWGANRAGFLAPEYKNGSLATRKVDFPEVYQIWKKREAIFVDARPVSAFQQGHLPGAINVPVNNIEQALSVLPMDRGVRLITYCGSIECPNSYQLMRALLGYGYHRVQFFPRGVRGWVALGYPLEKGNPTETQKP
jgi:rhodanese-related sulfurtransferase